MAEFDMDYHERDYGEPIFWVHDKDEDCGDIPSFRRHRPEFWKKYIDPITNRLENLFK